MEQDNTLLSSVKQKEGIIALPATIYQTSSVEVQILGMGNYTNMICRLFKALEFKIISRSSTETTVWIESNGFYHSSVVGAIKPNYSGDRWCETVPPNDFILRQIFFQGVQSTNDGDSFSFHIFETGDRLGKQYEFRRVGAQWLMAVQNYISDDGKRTLPAFGDDFMANARAIKLEPDLIAETDEDEAPTKSYTEQLASLVGLSTVKEEVKTLYNFVSNQQLRISRGMKTVPISYHCVFSGNPGTGKTTVARIIANIYKELGVLKKGHFVETDRSGLVAEYIGQTAVKTNKIIDSALDGVLFIDEAYSLATGGENDFGSEAIATLLKRMEDDRDRLIVILAGYSDEMEYFIDTNPGLKSRFSRNIFFPDYSEDELVDILLNYISEYEYTITDDALDKARQSIWEAMQTEGRNFGNGRFVRNLFETIVKNQANRIASIPNPSETDLTEIIDRDIS